MTHQPCSICGHPDVPDGGACPECGAPPRSERVAPHLPRRDRVTVREEDLPFARTVGEEEIAAALSSGERRTTLPESMPRPDRATVAEPLEGASWSPSAEPLPDLDPKIASLRPPAAPPNPGAGWGGAATSTPSPSSASTPPVSPPPVSGSHGASSQPIAPPPEVPKPPPGVKPGGSSGFAGWGWILAGVAVIGAGGCALVVVASVIVVFMRFDDVSERAEEVDEEIAVSSDAAAAVTCGGAKGHTRCVREAGDRYKEGELEEALRRTYEAPQPFFPERDAMALAAKAKPSWGTRERFGCDPAPEPCDVWAFWQADRGGPEAVEGIEALERRCEEGVADACHRLGLVVEDREEKPKLALTHYRAAWEGGDQAAGTAYGYMLAQTDYAAGVAILTAACDAGVLRACWARGLTERYVGKDAKAAWESFTEACGEGRGDLGGCAALGDVLYYDERRFDAARSWYQLACERGNHGACLGLADGRDRVDGQWGRARELLSRICREGSGEACWRMVQRSRERGAALSSEEARRLLKQGCAFGHKASCDAR